MLRIQGNCFRSQKSRLRWFFTSWILELPLRDELDFLLSNEGILVELIAALVLNNLVINAIKESCELVVFVLCPSVEGVVVAFGTTQAGTEKELGCSFGAIGRIAECPVVVSWRVVISASPSGKKFAHELVDSLALIKAFAHPAVEGLNPGVVQDLLLVAQEIGPLESPELRILRSLEKLLD